MTRSTHTRYTAAEDAAIVAQYRRGPLRALAATVDHSESSILKRAQRLAALGQLEPKQRFYGRPWSAAADDALRDGYGLLTDTQLAGSLHRSVAAVRSRAAVLGCRKRDAFLSAQAVARIFGVDSHKPAQWIAAGLLPARRGDVRCGNGYPWIITVAAVERFIARHPAHYRRERLTEEPWRGLAEATWRRDPLLDPDAAAELLGCCRETVLRHCRSGWLPAVRVRDSGHLGTWRIRRSALRAFRRRHPAQLTGIAAQNAATRTGPGRKAYRPRLAPTPPAPSGSGARPPQYRPVDWGRM